MRLLLGNHPSTGTPRFLPPLLPTTSLAPGFAVIGSALTWKDTRLQ